MEGIKGNQIITGGNRHVVAMPYPGRGHINPMINLCKLLSFKDPNIVISFVVTEEWRSLLSSYFLPNNIRFETIPNVIPSEHGRAKDFPAFLEAVDTKMTAPFEQLLDRLELPVNAIVADTYLGWVLGVGNKRNIPVASLWTMSATVFSIFHHFDLLVQNGHFPIIFSERKEERVDYIPGVPPTRLLDFPTIFNGAAGKTFPLAQKSTSIVSKAQYLIFTSAYELEPLAIDALKLTFPFPVYPLGPMVPYFELKHNSDSATTDQELPHYIEWLNSQPRNSVLYVSMGSFLSVSSTQLDEIVAGVRDSGVRFLWISRGDTSLFKDGCGDMGLVVPWCDQLRVLCHPSIGGFWSHCGWNSTLETAFAGVPVLASPIFWDQTSNSKKIVEDWKIGWRVKQGADGDSLVTREEIAKLVKRFMDGENSEAIELRKQSKEIQEACLKAISQHGSSDTNIDSFLKDISQCQAKEKF